jgi:hypothetical protein
MDWVFSDGMVRVSREVWLLVGVSLLFTTLLSVYLSLGRRHYKADLLGMWQDLRTKQAQLDAMTQKCADLQAEADELAGEVARLMLEVKGGHLVARNQNGDGGQE